MQTIYLLRCKRNGKYYIGRSSNPKRRYYDHMNVPVNDLIREDMKRYGRKSFELLITRFQDLPDDVAKIIEEYLIIECKTFIPEYGYNIRIGDKDPRTIYYHMKQSFNEWFQN